MDNGLCYIINIYIQYQIKPQHKAYQSSLTEKDGHLPNTNIHVCYKTLPSAFK